MTQDESGYENRHPNGERDEGKRAILLVAHGSTTESETGALARKLRTDIFYADDLDIAVEVAFWKEEPSIDTALARVDADEVYVLPLLMSDGYFFRECFPAMLDIEARPGEWQAHHGREVFYDFPVGESPFLRSVLLEIVADSDRQISEKPAEDSVASFTDADATVLLVGHGTPRNNESTKEVLQRVHMLREELPHRDIRAAFIDDSPALSDVFNEVEGHVIVVPWFIADGMHPTVDIPAALVLPKRNPGQWFLDHDNSGRAVVLTPALGSIATFRRIVIQMAHAAFNADIRRPAQRANDSAASSHRDAICTLEECIYQEEKYRFGDLVVRTGSDRYESEAYQVQIRRKNAGTNGGTLLEPDVAHFEHSVIAARAQQTPVPYAQDNAELTGGFTTDDIRLVARAIETVYPGALHAWHQAQIGEKPGSFAESTKKLPSRLRKKAATSEADVADAVAKVCDTCCQRTPHWHRPDAPCDNNLSCRAPCHAIYKALG